MQTREFPGENEFIRFPDKQHFPLLISADELQLALSACMARSVQRQQAARDFCLAVRVSTGLRWFELGSIPSVPAFRLITADNCPSLPGRELRGVHRPRFAESLR